MLHKVPYCWYTHLFFLFCFCLPLNPRVVPTEEVRPLSQIGMSYCCVFHGRLFLTVFILLIQPSYCVPGAIKCTKEDLTKISSLTQYDDHQISDVILLFGSAVRLIGGDKRGIRSAGTMDSAEISILHVTPKNH